MFIYKIIQGKKLDEFDTEQVLFETRDRKELLKKYPYLKEIVKDAEKQAKKSVKEREKEVKNKASDFPLRAKLEFIYAPTTIRTFIKTDKLPDEYLLLEVEYIPVKELINEIEKKTGKKININLNRPIAINIDEKRKRIHIKQYNPEKKRTLSIFTSTKYDDELLILFEILKDLVGGK